MCLKFKINASNGERGKRKVIIKNSFVTVCLSVTVHIRCFIHADFDLNKAFLIHATE